MTPGSDPVRQLASLFSSHGARGYPGEPVSQASHMLQAAVLAESAGAPPALVAAALLHDVGHFPVVASGPGPVRGWARHHAAAGARWLSQWFGPEVTGPIRLHVDAKRYLCAVEPGYLGSLPDASRYTLAVQGGPMTAAEMAAFEAHPQACDALRVRRWDDAAKDAAASPPAFGYYQPLLRRLLRVRGPGPGVAGPGRAAAGQPGTSAGPGSDNGAG
jgi:gamma-butyrobetaine dioxygenase